MKKIVSSIILSVCGLCCFANDVIVTRNLEKIEGKIIEVSKNEIKYKKASNPDGPTFVIETNEVGTIVYENGEIEVYKEDQQTQSFNSVQNEKKVGKLYFDRVRHPNGKKRLAYHNADNSIIWGDAELAYHLEENCPEAYSHWKMVLEYAKNPFGAPSVIKGIKETLNVYNEKCAEE